MTRPQGKNSGSRELKLVVGVWAPSIGGPYQTVLSYRAILSAYRDPQIVGLSPARGVDRVVAEPGLESVEILAGAWYRFPGLLMYAWKSRFADVVVFGVWHPMFFAFGILRLVARRGVAGRRILVPTQSLSAWDWAKRRRAKRLLRPAVIAMLHRFDVVIFATEGERRTSIPELPEDRTIVIYHPIQPVGVHNAAPGGASPRVVFLGRLTLQKAVGLFIDAFAELPPEWEADIVGQGADEYVAALRERASLAGCGDRIRWHGWLPRSEALSVMVGASALLVTSQAENYCHAAVEAMALNVPVVMVDRVAASIDLRRNGTGLVVSAEPATLAAAAEEVRVRRPKAMLNRAKIFADERASGRDGELLASVVFEDSP